MYKIIATAKAQRAGTLSKEFESAEEPSTAQLDVIRREMRKQHIDIYHAGAPVVDLTVRKVS